MASIQEKYDSLTKAHQDLAKEIVNDLLILERLETGLDRYITWLNDHPTVDDSPGQPPKSSKN